MDIHSIIRKLKSKYQTGGYRGNPFESLIATILSQRTRDENTHKAMKNLFLRYNTPEKILRASEQEIQELIKSSGFYRVKTKKIKEVSRILLEKHGGRVPSNIDELLALPSVGRKTANCVLVYGFGKPAIPVDTHVHRISNRIGLVETKSPDETEKELRKAVPKRYWIDLNELFVKHGQSTCKPLKPRCKDCIIIDDCNFEGKDI